jgi:hypothetical protein
VDRDSEAINTTAIRSTEDTMEELIGAVDEVLRLLRSNKDCADPVLETPSHGSGQQCKSFWEDIPRELRDRASSLARSLDDSKNQQNAFISRSVGTMVGMAVADGLGHNFEFLPATDHVGGLSGDGPRIEYDEGSTGSVILHKPLNVFELKPGQWTDDASMGLCLADSLLVKGCFDGSHCRILFYNWWNTGLNNAFKFDPSRNKKSVGLVVTFRTRSWICKSTRQIVRKSRPDILLLVIKKATMLGTVASCASVLSQWLRST